MTDHAKTPINRGFHSFSEVFIAIRFALAREKEQALYLIVQLHLVGGTDDACSLAIRLRTRCWIQNLHATACKRASPGYALHG